MNYHPLILTIFYLDYKRKPEISHYSPGIIHKNQKKASRFFKRKTGKHFNEIKDYKKVKTDLASLAFQRKYPKLTTEVGRPDRPDEGATWYYHLKSEYYRKIRENLFNKKKPKNGTNNGRKGRKS